MLVDLRMVRTLIEHSLIGRTCRPFPFTLRQNLIRKDTYAYEHLEVFGLKNITELRTTLEEYEVDSSSFEAFFCPLGPDFLSAWL